MSLRFRSRIMPRLQVHSLVSGFPTIPREACHMEIINEWSHDLIMLRSIFLHKPLKAIVHSFSKLACLSSQTPALAHPLTGAALYTALNSTPPCVLCPPHPEPNLTPTHSPTLATNLPRSCQSLNHHVSRQYSEPEVSWEHQKCPQEARSLHTLKFPPQLVFPAAKLYSQYCGRIK